MEVVQPEALEMAWWQRKRATKNPRRVRLEFEILEDRVTPAALSPYDSYALQVVNQLRSNPAAFAADLRQLYLGNNYQSSYGYSANDPIWTDLRSQINSAEASSAWRSGFTSGGSNTFLAVASALAARAPLVWDSGLQDGAIGHNSWMYSNVYAHSVFSPGDPVFSGESPGNAIPGLTRNFNPTGDYFNFTGLSLAGENVSYLYNDTGAAFQAYRNGQITLDGYYQRLVYADVIGFMLEHNNGNSSSPWGHLVNLTDTYNVIGLNTYLYENPAETQINGVAQSYFSTQRFGQRNGVSYANLFVFLDANTNGLYDPGEGLNAVVNVNGTPVTLTNGYGAVQIASTGSYTFVATYNGGTLGTQTLTANGSNRNVSFAATSLTDTQPPVSSVERLAVYQPTPNFQVRWTGSDDVSGVHHYDVFVSVDGGAFTPWLSGTGLGQATYNGAYGHRYAFYTVATDREGRIEAVPSSPDASTEVRWFNVPAPSNLFDVARGLTHSDEQFSNFIRGAYQTYLGRAADNDGLSYWLGMMRTGQVSDERLEAFFVGSDEYILAHGGRGAGWVTGMYQDLLGRSPDASEVSQWVAQLNAGVSPSAVAYGFAASAERQSIRVRQNYLTYLGRAADASEVNLWVDQFVNRGMTTEVMAAGFVGSAEFYANRTKGQGTFAVWIDQAIRTILNRAAAAEEIGRYSSVLSLPTNYVGFANSITHSAEAYQRFITDTYNAFLGRAPDASGLSAWLNALSSGAVNGQMMEAQFIGSDEYIASHGGRGAGWVTGMYQNLLGRSPAPSEVAGWVAQLNAGVSPVTIAYGFAASAERTGNRVRQAYIDVLRRTPSQGEINGWVNQYLYAGMTDQRFLASLISTREYYVNTAKGNGNTTRWLDAVWADINKRDLADWEISMLIASVG